MPIYPAFFVVHILIGAIVGAGVSIMISGIIHKTDIIKKIKEFIRKHKYKNKNTNKDEDVIGAMIREVAKNKKTVKVDILNSNFESVSVEVFQGKGVSEDIYEGEVIYV